MPTLDYRRSEGSPRLSMTLAIASCIIGICGNVFGMLMAATLRHEPIGASIRPMGLALRLFMTALGTLGIGWVVGLIAIATSRRRFWVVAITFIGMILCLMPYFTSHMVWDYFETQRGLIMEP